MPLDYDSLGSLGTFFGAASLIVVDDRCCMVQLALRSKKFYMHESCGKCTPCREGTRWMVQLLEKIEAGAASLRPRPARDGRLPHPRRSLCALGDFAVYPVRATCEKCRSEFVAHVEQGGCPFGGESSLEGIVAPATPTRSDRDVPSDPGRLGGATHERARAGHLTSTTSRSVPRATAWSRRRSPPGSRSPSSATSRGSGHRSARAACASARSRACRSSQTACTMTARTGWSCQRAHLGEGGRGAELHARVHPRQPPARLPDLRQGRRVPAAGPDVPLWPRRDAHDFPKRTFEKPIPISPTIALDRERCILCYRCTRFTESVSEDPSSSR